MNFFSLNHYSKISNIKFTGYINSHGTSECVHERVYVNGSRTFTNGYQVDQTLRSVRSFYSRQ
jgi:hypothetical protein